MSRVSLFRSVASRSRSIISCAAIAVAAQMTSAATHNPANSSALTTLLNGTTLQLGDTIVLNAGTIYEGTFTLPNKTTGSGYITIQSSNLASLPAAGTRVNLTHASNMPRIRPVDAFGPAFKTATSAHHFKFIGLEVTGPTVNTQPDGVSNITYGPFQLGTSGTGQDTLAEVPHNIIIDRCIIRANSNLQRIKWGIQLNSASTDITNCYIADFKTAGQDGQAIAGYNGPGPFNIINNFIEAATENVMFGGSVPTIPNLVPSDIVIKQNHFHKPLTWNQNHASYNGNNWSIKNLFELKNARNVLLEGNIFENHWVDSQPGWCIVLSPANDGPAPWTVVEDVTFRNNIIRHTSGGPNILGYDQGGDPSEQTARITFENNLFYDVGGSLWGGLGKLFQILSSTDDVVINHNTAFHTTTFVNADGGPHTGFVFTNNIVNREAGYGIFGSGLSEGNLTLNTLFPSAVFTANVIKSGTSSKYNQYPGNFFPANWDFLVNKVGGDYENGDWDIDPGHAYQTAGTDGLPLGANIADIVDATAGCISGVWSSQPTTITLKNGVNGYSGATSFHVRGQAPTTHYGPSRYYHEADSRAGTSGYVLRTFYKFDVSQAASGIPSGSTVTNAKLRIKLEFRSHTYDYGISCFRMAPASSFTVNYATATRNTYNGTNNWTGGANAAGDVADSNNDFVDTVVDNNSTIPAVGTWIEFDVTSAVQAWVNGTANNGLLIKTNTGSSIIAVRLSTPADSHGSTEYPTLEVTYQ